MLGFEEIFRKIDETIALGGVQLLLQGGHNPDLPIEWYEDLFRPVKQRYPDVQAARAVAARSDPPLADVAAAGAGGHRSADRRRARQHPGGGAEILVDRVRKLLNCYGKATADEWLDVMRHAHRAGLRTTATMMYGHVETVEERLEHCSGCATCRTRPAGSPRSSPGAISRSTPSSAATRRPASSTCACSRSRGSCSTTSPTCRRRGSRRAARSGSSAWRSAPTTWAA